HRRMKVSHPTVILATSVTAPMRGVCAARLPYIEGCYPTADARRRSMDSSPQQPSEDSSSQQPQRPARGAERQESGPRSIPWRLLIVLANVTVLGLVLVRADLITTAQVMATIWGTLLALALN